MEHRGLHRFPSAMPRSRLFRVLVPLALVLASLADAWALADEPAAAQQAPKVASPVASPRVIHMLSAATPKFVPDKKSDASAARARVEHDVPANGIVRLAPYIVRELPLPKREEVMTPSELEKMAMQRYLGDEDGLDRGVLNLFTVKSLWKKLPVLGRYPLVGFSTNEERAMAIYRDEKAKEESAKLEGLYAPEGRAPPAKGAPPSIP